MKKRLLFLSVFAASIVILVSFTTVVGVETTKTNSKINSPLFKQRVNSMINKKSKDIQCNYIGKGSSISLFYSKKSFVVGLMDRAIKLIESKPEVIDKIFDKAKKIPYIMNILSQNGISEKDLTKYITQIKNNPDIIKQNKDQLKLNSDNDPIPLGLSTSSAIGCLITVIAFLPLAIVLGLLIGTITIITCLNVGGCFEALLEGILQGMLQNLNPA